MAPGYTFLLGGARSGKSSLAQQMAEHQPHPVCVVATAQPIDGDMAARIARHRADRPADWTTVEEPLDVAEAVRNAEGFLIIDCLTVWLGNALHHGWTDDRVMDEVDDVVDALRTRSTSAVVVSNEVGLGVHPETPLGRAYRDLLGHVNTRVARGAAESHLLVAGRILTLEDPRRIIGSADGR